MDNNIIQFVGGPCGQHGPYTFYKAFKYKNKNGLDKIVTLSEFFFVKLWMDSDLLCIGEMQLLWVDKNSEQILTSLRLYFLPENTPEGRMDHGEDEVLAIAEKVVLRVEDLVTWITMDAEWTWGRLGNCSKHVKEPPDDERDENNENDDENINDDINPVSLESSSLDFSDVEKEKRLLETESESDGPSVVILSYPRYCRYRSMMRRLEGVENEYLKYKIVKALGGFSFNTKNTRVMFCRDTFEYPELEGHELLCNHLAPKLKGRPRGKRKKRSVSPGSESNESESSVSSSFNIPKLKGETSFKNGLCNSNVDSSIPRRSTRSSDNSETKEFMKKLTAFMKIKRMPFGRAPCIGFKEIDLYDFYTKVQKLGGYDVVSSNRLWKSIFDEMSGHQSATAAATILRRHYERFLLPYERHMRGEEYKPLPISERRRLKSKSNHRNSSESVSCTNSRSESPPSSTSSGSNSDTSSRNSISPGSTKELSANIKQQESKISSLRSVRVKPERQKEKFAKVVRMEEITSSNNNAIVCDSLEITKISDEEVKMENVDEIKIENIDEMKVENNEETKMENTDEVKTENEEKIKTENVETSIKFEKNEPLTTAVAPLTKIENSKTPTPVEKEEIPSSKSTENGKIEMEVIEKSPKIPSTNDKSEELEELKRGKLDILKEGGLEVTPVKVSKDITRPSVIHNMPPPTQKLPINIPQSLNISKVTISPTPNIFSNQKPPTTPPKVVQSKSIYSYSEKTVYGNPKDCLVVHYATPIAPVNLKKSSGDLLDLTIKSPQKPLMDRTATATTARTNSHAHYSRNMNQSASLPILEGRKLGSNLEITLVPTDKTNRAGKNHHHQKHSQNKRPGNVNVNANVHQHLSKYPKIEENGRYHNKPSTSSHRKEKDVPSYKIGPQQRTPIETQQFKQQQQFPGGGMPGYQHYMSQLYESNKGISPYFPMIDPLLYSAAMQSLYPNVGSLNHTPPHTATTAPPPSFLQQYSQEQLKLYGELMAHNSRLPFPFQNMPPLQDTTTDYGKNMKK